MKESVVIFGFGNVASHLASIISSHNYKLSIVSRNELKKKDVNKSGATFVNYNGRDVKDCIDNADYIISTVPPSYVSDAEIIDPVVSLIYKNCLAEFREKKKKSKIKLITYLSSTGVYGDSGGDYLDENTNIFSNLPKALNRLKAEKNWRDLGKEIGCNVACFRLSGIYGPYNSALDMVTNLNSYSIFKENHSTSRIHVSDICQAIVAAMDRYQSFKDFEIFNITDDEPAPTYLVNDFASDLIGTSRLPIKNWSDDAVSDRMREFYINDRKISNLKMKKFLLSELQFPNFRAGLSDIFLKKQYKNEI